MILIGLGANLPTGRYGPPERGLASALRHLAKVGVSTVRRSRWYRSAPVPASDQPWYVNGVAAVETALSPQTLLAHLLETEIAFGRERRALWEARVLDLDLLDFDGQVMRQAQTIGEPALHIPHPRMAERAFVLLPLAEVAPDWRHPETGFGLAQLIAALPKGQTIEAMDGGGPCISPETAY